MGTWSSFVRPFTVALFIVTAILPAHAGVPGVRHDDPLVADLMMRGKEKSATFRRLLGRLEKSDLIVHVRRSWHLRRDSGFTQFITRAGGFRFVRITVNVSGLTDGAVALLGHELRHAVELADSPEVHDLEGYHGLYKDIGYASCDPGGCFDTPEAVLAGRRVLAEMLGMAGVLPPDPTARPSADTLAVAVARR